MPPFVKNKLAQVTAKLARHDYPLRWPTLVHDLVALADAPEADAPFATDVFCRVLDALDEEIISSGDTIREQGEGQRNPARPPPASVRVKDAIRADGDAAAKLADVWRRRVARGDRAAAATARRYVEWMDVGLFVHPSDETAPPPGLGNDASSFVAAAKGLLASDDDDLRGAGAELLAALAQKGMDRASKLALVVRRLGLVDACLAMPPTGDEGRDVISAGLVRAVGHELFACLGPPKGGGSSANNLDDATSAAAFAAVERLLPVAVAHARSATSPAPWPRFPCSRRTSGGSRRTSRRVVRPRRPTRSRASSTRASGGARFRTTRAVPPRAVPAHYAGSISATRATGGRGRRRRSSRRFARR